MCEVNRRNSWVDSSSVSSELTERVGSVVTVTVVVSCVVVMLCCGQGGVPEFGEEEY